MPDNLISTNGPELASATPEMILGSFRLSETGLIPKGNPTMEQWLEVGGFINRSEKLVHFWIGDWLNYGEKAWGEKYKSAITATNYDYSTLRDDKWVASSIPPERRQAQLTFWHHRQVADLQAEEQDALLAIAAENKLSVEKFRKVVREHNAPLQDKSLSGRPDKSTTAQKLIDNILALSRQVSDTKVDQFTPEEAVSLTQFARELRVNLDTFIALYENPDDSST